MVNKNHPFNGVSPSTNGHAPATNGHEVSYNPAQMNLPWADFLPASDPTARKESPEAEHYGKPAGYKAILGFAETEEKKKTRYASSISNTLTHCDQFIASVITYGPAYISSNALYGLPNLQSMRDTGYLMVKNVTSCEGIYKYAVAHRIAQFEELTPLLTRIMGELILSGASEVTVSQARSIVRKLRGARTVPKNPSDPVAVYHSVSQMNYDDLIANFDRLLSLVNEDANYDPAIDDLKILSLETRREDLRSANSDVYTTKAELDAARMERNSHFNDKDTGLVDIFIVAKKVVLTNFSSRSEQFKKISGLSYRRIV